MVNASNRHASNGDVVTQIEVAGATLSINWSQGIRHALARFGIESPAIQTPPPMRPPLKVVK